MRRLLLGLSALLGLSCLPAQSQTITTPEITAIVCAQNAVSPTIASGQFGLIQCDPYGRPYVTPIGFTPLGAYATPISVTTTSAANLLPSGASVTIYNTGANAAYVKFGAASSVTATTSNDVIPAGGGCGFNIGSNTYIATLTAASTTTLNISGGSGAAPNCWGSGTSIGGGTVTSVSWTGGLVSVATPTTTPAFTVAGTSGGIPYFNSASTWASSALLTNNALLLGGGAAASPTALGSLGTTTTLLHGNAAGAPTFAAVNIATEVTGTLSVGNGGTGQTSVTAAFNALSPMTTAGDLIYCCSAGNGTRLAAGTAAQALHSGTTPSWGNIIGSITRQKITTTGTYTAPANLVTADVDCVGSGGGGGGVAGGATTETAGGGGGSGTRARSLIAAATIGATQTVTIGAAGTAGAAGANSGGTGGDVTFGALVTAKGGGGGVGAASGTGGDGAASGSAASSVGDMIFKGGEGGPGIGATISTIATVGGYGGGSEYGGSSRGAINAAGAAPSANCYGCGGPGAQDNASNTSRAGAAGIKGICIITEYNSQ